MPIDRRTFLAAAALAATGASATCVERRPQARHRTTAVVFDGFAVLDPRPIAALTTALVGARGPALWDAWRTKQFEYQWLHALGGRYVDFPATTAASLRFAATQMSLTLPESTIAALLRAYLTLDPWPDAAAGLHRLHASGLRLMMLSNMTPAMIAAGLSRGDVAHLFTGVLSTDTIRSYKPAARAYQMVLDAQAITRDEVLFVPSAGWDVAGAVWFGYPTYWLNRNGAALEELDAAPDGAGTDFAALTRFALARDGRPAPPAGADGDER